MCAVKSQLRLRVDLVGKSESVIARAPAGREQERPAGARAITLSDFPTRSTRTGRIDGPACGAILLAIHVCSDEQAFLLPSSDATRPRASETVHIIIQPETRARLTRPGHLRPAIRSM